MPRRRSIRLKTFDYVGEYRCFFTLSTHRRPEPFTSREVVDAVLLRFQHSAELEDIAIAAYCFMPDHLHLFSVARSPISDSWRFVTGGRQRAGFWYARHAGQRLWYGRIWDRVLRSNDSATTVVRYVFANPIKAGLVTDPFAYPFSGSQIYSRQQLEEILREPTSIPNEEPLTDGPAGL